MKITFFFFFAGLLQVSASVYSQQTKLDVKASKVSVIEVLKMIEDQSDFHFLYRSDHLKGISVEAVDLKGAKLEDILDEVIVPYGFTYEIDDRTVVIKKSRNDQNEEQQTQKKRIIRGTVKDEKRLPLPGANVMVLGTTIGQISDAEGKFSLEVPVDAKIIEFSFVGMNKQQITITDKSVIEVIMKEIPAGLNEVVVVGYGSQKKVNLTGSVDAVSGAVLQNRPAANIGALLQGISPNLNITPTNMGGEPGAGTNFNIRGIGRLAGGDTPLILVDGVEMNINNLDPETIESVSVLKDAASSAVYGARAPFGVVLITTKKGTKNKGVTISYNNNIDFSSPTKLPSWQSSLRYVTAYNQALHNSGQADKFLPAQIDRIKQYMAGTYTPEYDTINPPNNIWAGRHEGNANYEWFDEYFKDVTVNQKHSINISGGDEKNQFYISTGYYDQGGSYNWAKEYYNRYNVLANFTSQATSWLRVNVNTKYANTKSKHPNMGSDWDPNRNFVIGEMIKFFPTTTFYNVNGTINNPYVLALQQAGPAKSNENDLFIGLGAELEPVKGWKTNVNYSYNYTGNVNTWLDGEIWAELPDGQKLEFWNNPTYFTQRWNSNNYQSFNTTTSYEKTTNGHFFKAMAGYEREYRYYSRIGGVKTKLITQEIPSFSTALGDIWELSDAMSHSATEAVFGRLNYNYKEKYLLEVNGRYNGSSKFAKDSRWGFFPSVSGGYNISRENFWEPFQKQFSNLKLRGSYGSLGNQNVPNYQYLSSIPISTNLNWILDGNRPLYTSIPAIISPTLTWETINMLDFGLDAGLLNNRLAITYDWYQRNTSKMFGPAMIIPATLGTTPPQENNASLSTKGWELSLEWKDRINEDFNYSLRFTLSDWTSHVTKYLNLTGQLDNFYAGKELGEIWGYKTAGLIQTAEEAAAMPNQSYIYSKWGPGDIKYTDLNNDGKINDGKRTLDDHGDIQVIGNSNPRYSYGFSGSVTWKNVDFSMFWQGIVKRDLVPNGNMMWGVGTRGDSGGAFYQGHDNYWRPADETNLFGPNTDAYYAKPYVTTETYKNQVTQSRYLLNGAYLRLKKCAIRI